MANSSLSVIGTDFSSLKANLKTFMQGQTAFQNYDFEGSNVNTLLDVLSYNSYMNLFYVNQSYNETFLDSALLRDSIVSRAKELNYIPTSFVCAVSNVNITTLTTDNPDYITMPAGTQFTSKIDNTVYTFNTLENVILNYEGSNTYSASNVLVYEGSPVTEVFLANTNDSSQRYVLSNPGIDTSTLKVYIQNSLSDTTTTEFAFSETLLDINANSNVYFMQGAANGNYEIIFGNGITGTQLQNGNYVISNYLSSSGDAPNGCNTFNISTSFWSNSLSVSVTTNSSATGGAVAESNSSIQFNAPRHYQTQERAITPQDYKSLLKKQYSKIRTLNVYGGEDAIPPQYGSVIISIDLNGDLILSDSDKTSMTSFIKSRNSTSISPVFIDPQFLYVKVGVNVNYNISASTTPSATIKTNVANTILNFNSTYLDDFDSTLYFSRLSSAIDNTDTNIISNDLSLQVASKQIPSLTSLNSWTINFGQALVPGSLQSTLFVLGNTITYFGDDSNGIVNLYTVNSSGVVSIVSSNVGNIDYSTGTVIVANVEVDSYSGVTLDIVVSTVSKDITSTMNSILTMTSGDIIVDVTPIRA